MRIGRILNGAAILKMETTIEPLVTEVTLSNAAWSWPAHAACRQDKLCIILNPRFREQRQQK